MAIAAPTAAPGCPGCISALRAGQSIAGRVHPQGGRHRRAVRTAVRRLDGVSRPARRAHGERLDSDRGAGDFRAQTARRVDHPREQHRPDDRVGWRIDCRRRRLHRPGVDLPRLRSGLFQLLPAHDADLDRRRARRADDGAAAPGADREGARHPAVSGRHRLRRGAGRRRTRRQAGVAGVQRSRRSARSGRRCPGCSTCSAPRSDTPSRGPASFRTRP